MKDKNESMRIGDQGKSIVRRDYPENIREYADWAADLINATGYEKAHIVGCSMGGWIAHGTAIFHPDVVNKLILISPAAGIPEKTTWGKYLFSLMFNHSEKNVRRIISILCGPYGAGEDWADYMYLASADPKSAKLAFPKKFKDNELKITLAPTLLLIGDHEVIYKSIDDVFTRASISTFLL